MVDRGISELLNRFKGKENLVHRIICSVAYCSAYFESFGLTFCISGSTVLFAGSF